MKPISFKGNFINGKFIKNHSGPIYTKKDPGDLTITIGTWRENRSSVDDAVISAKKASSHWSWIPLTQRLGYLKKLQRIFRRRHKELAWMISREMGKPLHESESEMMAVVAKFDRTWESLNLLHPQQGRDENEITLFHPRGVLAVIGPFNFPVHLPNGHWVPALATGNVVVFKPSELTPFTGQMIAECFDEAGFPPGVFNMIHGFKGVGKKLCSHTEVNGILFTGSDKVGHKIYEQTLRDPGKICVLEMGGKNAILVFPDAPMDEAVKQCTASALLITGQRCNAMSRLLLHEQIADQFIPRLVNAVKNWRIGYFEDSTAQMGPLVSRQAYKKFQSYQDLAIKDRGIENLLESRPIKSIRKGYYVSPSIHRIKHLKFDKIKDGYHHDEIFGPDIAIYLYKNTEEAIRIHNHSRYGLTASVFTKEQKIFEEMYRHLEVGNLYWNAPTTSPSSYLPFGGVKASGNHFPSGFFASYYCTYPVAVKL